MLKLITVDETGIDELEEEEKNLVFMGYFVISTWEWGFPCWPVFVFVVCFKSMALEIWNILGGKSCKRVLENVFSRCDYPVVDIYGLNEIWSLFLALKFAIYSLIRSTLINSCL